MLDHVCFLFRRVFALSCCCQPPATVLHLIRTLCSQALICCVCSSSACSPKCCLLSPRGPELRLLSIYSSSLFFLTFCPACPAPLASLSDMHLSHCYTACSFALVISPALSACDCYFISWQGSFSLPIALKTPLACKLAAVMHLAFYHFP